jgi:hypothetical protein
MKRMQTFEEYDPTLHKTIDMNRSLIQNKTTQKIIHILSLIDDLVHFDLKTFKYEIKNKELLDKIAYLTSELTLALKVYLESGTISDEEIFRDMDEYGFDVDNIIQLIEDPQVIDYLKIDKRGRKKYEEKFTNIIDFLRKYQMWKKGKNIE